MQIHDIGSFKSFFSSYNDKKYILQDGHSELLLFDKSTRQR